MLKKIAMALPLFWAIADVCCAKVLIITHAYNRPDFIEMQYLTFHKYLQDEYEFIVFNDAPPGATRVAIKEACQDLGVSCIPIPTEIHVNTAGISERHSETIQYSLDVLGYHYEGIVAFFDSDLFLVRPLSIENLMDGFDVVSAYRLGVWGQGVHLKYFWPGLCFLRMNALPNRQSLNFNNGLIDGYTVDTGGYTYHYLQENPIRVKFLDQFPFRFHHEEVGCNAMEQLVLHSGAEFAYNRYFLHMGAASYEQSPIKSLAVKQFISSVLEP